MIRGVSRRVHLPRRTSWSRAGNSRQAEEERKRLLGDGMVIDARRGRDHDSQPVAGRDIDGVETDTRAGQDAQFWQLLQQVRRIRFRTGNDRFAVLYDFEEIRGLIQVEIPRRMQDFKAGGFENRDVRSGFRIQRRTEHPGHGENPW